MTTSVLASVIYFLIELGLTVLLVLALLITSAALWDVRPPKGPQW